MKIWIYYWFQTDIRVLHEGGCTLHETYRALGRNAHVKACSSPRRMFEKNPICTSNNQTYENPFVTICLAGSFMHVREKIGGPCGNPTQRSCEKVTKLHESLKSASITERTKFLACGSDLRTYRSEHHLECSRPFNRCNTFDKQILYFGSSENNFFFFYQIYHWHILDAVSISMTFARRNWNMFKQQRRFAVPMAIHTSHLMHYSVLAIEWIKVCA